MIILNVSYEVFKEAAALFRKYYFTRGNDILLGTGNNDFVFLCKIFEDDEINDFNENLHPSCVRVYREDDIAANIILESFSITKYDITETYSYIGSAKPGSSGDQSVWKIRRTSFDESGNPTDEKFSEANVIWDNRAILTYI